MGDPIKRVELPSGEIRWRSRVDLGRDPVTGKRKQQTITTRTRKENQRKRADNLSAREAGTLVMPSGRTLRQVCESWLAGRRGVRASTLRTYRHTLNGWLDARLPSGGVLGEVRADRLSLDQLRHALSFRLSEDGRRRGTAGAPLTRTTLKAGLARLRAVLLHEARQGHTPHAIVDRLDLLELPSGQPRQLSAWTGEQAGRYLVHVRDDRLYVAWLLSLYGMRRGEVLGLRWADIDLTGQWVVDALHWPEPVPTLTVRNARTVVDVEVVEGPPKSARSARTLPLDPDLVTALALHREQQDREREHAGRAYNPVCPLCQGEHVVNDRLGQPLNPYTYSQAFRRNVESLGLPPIRLHDLRRTAAVAMRRRGVEPAVISAWVGHASISFSMDTYALDPQLAQTGMQAAQHLRESFYVTSDVTDLANPGERERT